MKSTAARALAATGRYRRDLRATASSTSTDAHRLHLSPLLPLALACMPVEPSRGSWTRFRPPECLLTLGGRSPRGRSGVPRGTRRPSHQEPLPVPSPSINNRPSLHHKPWFRERPLEAY